MFKQKMVLAFDMDGTLVESRLDTMPNNTKEMLRKLVADGYKVTIISSGGIERLYRQIQDVDIHLIGNYGLQEGDIIDGKLVITRQDQIREFKEDCYLNNKINTFRKLSGFDKYKGRSYIINQAGFVIIPLIGEDADKISRDSFDVNKAIRKSKIHLLKDLFPNSVINISGKTSFDIITKNYNKYIALKNYCDSLGCAINQALFFGDELLDEWGNDYSIKENNVDCVNVGNYKEIVSIVKKYINII